MDFEHSPSTGHGVESRLDKTVFWRRRRNGVGPGDRLSGGWKTFGSLYGKGSDEGQGEEELDRDDRHAERERLTLVGSDAAPRDALPLDLDTPASPLSKSKAAKGRTPFLKRPLRALSFKGKDRGVRAVPRSFPTQDVSASAIEVANGERNRHPGGAMRRTSAGHSIDGPTPTRSFPLVTRGNGKHRMPTQTSSR